MGLTIAIPTIGRPTLARTMFSFLGQLEDGDEVIFVADPKGDPDYVRFVYELGSKRNGVNWVFATQAGDGWGHPQRNRAYALAAPSNHVWCIADDDVATPDALNSIRWAAAYPEHGWMICRAGRGGDAPWVWQDFTVRVGNLDADCIVAPARVKARWGLDYEGDAAFARALRAELGEPMWVSSVIAVAMPSAEYLDQHYAALSGVGVTT